MCSNINFSVLGTEHRLENINVTLIKSGKNAVLESF